MAMIECSGGVCFSLQSTAAKSGTSGTDSPQPADNESRALELLQFGELYLIVNSLVPTESH
jgi:hypothetical protein